MAGLLGLYLALGVLYSVVAPVFESSDEIRHYPVVKYLADGQGLPVQPQPEGYPWFQEGSQPPLYYLLGALLTFWIDTGSPQEMIWPNPHANTGVPLAPDNKNMAIHIPREAFPYRGVYLAVHLIRLFSVALGALTVLCTYLIAQELFPQSRALALGAAAFNAFLPMFLFVHASVTNDTLVNALSALVLLLLVRSLRRGVTGNRVLLLGLLLGLAALSKLTGLGLFPLAALTLFLAARRQGAWRALPRWAGVTFGLSVLVAGWWYLRNYLQYGDPTALNVFLDTAGVRDPIPALWELLPEFPGLFISLWGLFGGSNVLMSEWIYQVLNLLALGSLLGWGLLALQSWRGKAWLPLGPLLILLLWVLLLGVALLRWTQLTPASLGRLLFPSISALALFFALGLGVWFPPRLRGAFAGILGFLGFVLAAAVPFAFILPAYPGPTLLTEASLATVQHPTHIVYGEKAELVGYDLSTSRVGPGETLRVSLYWRGLQPMTEDYSVYLHLFGPGRRLLGQRDSYPGLGAYPTRLWRPGDILRDTLQVAVDEAAVGPSALWVEVGLYRLEGFQNLPAYDGRGQRITPTIARLKLAPRQAPPLQVPHEVKVELGGRIVLEGYALEGNTLRPGEPLRLTLFWRAKETPERDYTVFVHLVGPEEDPQLWGQIDRQPQGGNYPTSLWEPGEMMRDEYELPIAPGAPPGDYRLLVGMYALPELVHLPMGPEGRPSWPLASLRLGPS